MIVRPRVGECVKDRYFLGGSLLVHVKSLSKVCRPCCDSQYPWHPCPVLWRNQGRAGGRKDHFSPTGIHSASCHSNWPSNPLPVAKCLVWFGHFVQIKPKRLKGDLLGLLGRKIPCSWARAPRCALHPFLEETECTDNPGSVAATLPQWGRCQAVLREADGEKRVGSLMMLGEQRITATLKPALPLDIPVLCVRESPLIVCFGFS